MLFGKSRLTKALEQWVNQGGSLFDKLRSFRNHTVKSEAEVVAICAALEKLRREPAQAAIDTIYRPLQRLTELLENPATTKAKAAIAKFALPKLRVWVHDFLNGVDLNEDDVVLILLILAKYQQLEDVTWIAETARHPKAMESYRWPSVFREFEKAHPHVQDLIAKLRNPFPRGFAGVAFLDLTIMLSFAGRLPEHPFNSPTGCQLLEEWLTDTDPEKYSYAQSATACLAFLDPSLRKKLLLIAGNHRDPGIRLEAAWVLAKSGDVDSIEKLKQFTLDARYSTKAQAYLTELGHSALIPAETQDPNFCALVKMSNWLEHPNELGLPPDMLELLDTREMHWPPTNDRRRLWLIKYCRSKQGNLVTEVGIVGSITYSLYEEQTGELLPEDIYGLYCCSEMRRYRIRGAPEENSSRVGRDILRRFNADF
jgi:hypothetical protein